MALLPAVCVCEFGWVPLLLLLRELWDVSNYCHLIQPLRFVAVVSHTPLSAAVSLKFRCLCVVSHCVLSWTMAICSVFLVLFLSACTQFYLAPILPYKVFLAINHIQQCCPSSFIVSAISSLFMFLLSTRHVRHLTTLRIWQRRHGLKQTNSIILWTR